MRRKTWLAMALAAGLILALISGCGGGSSDSSSSGGGIAPSSVSTVSGTASKGPFYEGTVSVYALDDNGYKDEPALISGSIYGAGRFNLDIEHAGPVLVELTGGRYMDEATGLEKEIGLLRAVLPEVSGDIDIAVTPLTEMAVRMAGSGGFTPEKIRAANQALSQLICVDTSACSILTTLPVSPEQAAFDAADQYQQAYTLLLALISQMAADGDGDVMAVIEAILEDLDDKKLDDMGDDMLSALGDFLESDFNHTGATDPGDLDDILQALIDTGIEPTGDLAEAKRLLAEFLNDPTQAKFESFSSYMSIFVPETQEAHLFTAMAELMNIYASNAALFVTDGTSGLGLNLSAASTEGFQIEPYFANLLRMAAYSDNVAGLLSDLETRFDHVISELAQARGVNAVISLTGIDTVFLDDIDVQVLNVMAKVGRAVCIYLSSIDDTATQWEVPPAEGQEGPQDVRNLIEYQTGLTDAQAQAFLANNPLFLAYNASPRLAAFRSAIDSALADLQAAVNALDALGAEGRLARYQNAFNVDSEYELQQFKALAQQALPSMIAAMDDASASFVVPDSYETSRTIIRDEDGYSYVQRTYDIVLIDMDPNPAPGFITIHDLAGGGAGPRDLILAVLSGAEGYQPYVEGDATMFLQGVTATDWNEPIESYDIQGADITIDGNDADWSSVPVLTTLDGYTVKLAAGQGDDYYLYLGGGTEGLSQGDADPANYFLSVGMYYPLSQPVGEDYFYAYSLLGLGAGTINIQGIESGENDPTYLEVSEADRAVIMAGSVVMAMEIKFSQIDRLTPSDVLNYLYFSLDRGGIYREISKEFKLYP